MLREAVDDLEWATGGGQAGRATVHLYMRRDPRRLLFLARGAGELKVITGLLDTNNRVVRSCVPTFVLSITYSLLARGQRPLQHQTGGWSARIRVAANVKVHCALQVEFPVDSLTEFTCQGPQVRWSYKYRYLRAAFCNVPHQKDQAAVRTKVRHELT